MLEKPLTRKYFDKSIDKLGRMIKRSFDDVYQRFDKVDQRLDRIEVKLENIVYRKEFEELKARVEIIEEALAIKKK